MLEILVVVLCLILNSFFAAFEMAFVTVNKEDLLGDEEKNQKAKEILKLKKNPERTLSVIQIGITLIGAVSAAVGGNGAVESFSPYLEKTFDVSETAAEAISVTAVILPLTYLSVVFGELIPKTIALNNPKPILFYGIRFLNILDTLFSPLITFLEVSTAFVLKKLGLSNDQEEETEAGSLNINYLPMFHQKFVFNLVDLHGKKAREIMRPWSEVLKFNFADEDSKVEMVLRASSHTRFPVVDGDVMVGILHAKDFNSEKRKPGEPWQNLIRPVQTFSPTDKVLAIFKRLQVKRQHLAVIVEKETFLGIITIEDIIEEVVGDIYDEVEDSKTLKMFLTRNKVSIKR
jgi:putative hemolysin